MNNQLSYDIAGLRFRIHSQKVDLLNSVLTSFQPFLIDNYNVDKTHLFDFNLNETITCEGDKIYTFNWDGIICEIYQSATNYYILLYISDSVTEILKTDFQWKNIETSITEDVPHASFCIDLFMMFCYCFSSVNHDTLLVHASVIVCNNKAMIFQGKSGTGKSTHSGLWLKNFDDCFMLNDDNPVVRVFENGKTIVYGSPWSGKTHCYINQNYEVAAFVRLAQAPVNKLKGLSIAQSFASILPSCSNMIWDNDIHKRICETISKISVTGKCWNMEALPDADAAIMTRTIIDNTSDN